MIPFKNMIFIFYLEPWKEKRPSVINLSLQDHERTEQAWHHHGIQVVLETPSHFWE